MDKYSEATNLIKNARITIAFTGAGISQQSGIPTYRGKGGLYEDYDPEIFTREHFVREPLSCWEVYRDLFYAQNTIEPNNAHNILAKWEKEGLVQEVLTQNIDALHHKAGSKRVVELHGTTRRLKCLVCDAVVDVSSVDMGTLPPQCICGRVLKPDVVLFGEPIDYELHQKALMTVKRADLILIIGTSGEVMPAGNLPRECRGKIIEINPYKSKYTDNITDIWLEDNALDAMGKLGVLLSKNS